MPKLFVNRIFKKTGPPIHLIWFITSRCNLGCSHCFYHAHLSGGKNELSLGEIEKTVSHLSPLLSLSLTGGEPFLRDDLPEVAKLLSERKLTKNIVIYSNGFDTGTVLAAGEKILSFCQGINIFMNISIDGYEKGHDKYRNKEGAYKNAAATIKGLKALQNNFSNLNIGIGITLHKGNQHIVKDLREDIYSRFGIIPGVTMIRGEPSSPELKNVNTGIYKEVVEAVERDRRKFRQKSLSGAIIAAREALGQRLAYKTFITRSRSYDCYAGSLMGVIYANGDVHPCEILEDANIGNLRNYYYDINKIWVSARANEIRKQIKTRKCFCTYECQFTCNTLYNIRLAHYFILRALNYIFKLLFIAHDDAKINPNIGAGMFKRCINYIISLYNKIFNSKRSEKKDGKYSNENGSPPDNIYPLW